MLIPSLIGLVILLIVFIGQARVLNNVREFAGGDPVLVENENIIRKKLGNTITTGPRKNYKPKNKPTNETTPTNSPTT